MKHLRLATALAASVLFSASAWAQTPFATAESAIKYRQGAFSVMAAHFSRIAMMAQGIQPFDAKAAQENAELVSAMAKLPFAAFTPGSDKGAPNRAASAIWTESAKFKAASDRMVADAAKLEAAAKSGNFEAVRVAVGAVGQSCKSCHDGYRNSSRSE